MEIKKNPRVDLTRKSGFFFSVALVVTMSLVLTAFEWRQHEAKIDDLVQRRTDVFDMIDIPITEITPPPPPVPVVVPVIVEVPDDIEVPDDVKPSIDMSTTNTASVAVIEFKPIEEDEPTDVPFNFVESPASFDGGNAAFYRHVSNKIKYPTQARRIGVEGKVFVEFVINRDGTITDVKAIKKIGAGCDEEAERVIQSSPKWNPGKQRGKPVRQRMVLPITFQLN